MIGWVEPILRKKVVVDAAGLLVAPRLAVVTGGKDLVSSFLRKREREPTLISEDIVPLWHGQRPEFAGKRRKARPVVLAGGTFEQIDKTPA